MNILFLLREGVGIEEGMEVGGVGEGGREEGEEEEEEEEEERVGMGGARRGG